jgi:hypothetical protein
MVFLRAQDAFCRQKTGLQLAGHRVNFFRPASSGLLVQIWRAESRR